MCRLSLRYLLRKHLQPDCLYHNNLYLTLQSLQNRKQTLWILYLLQFLQYLKSGYIPASFL